MYPSPNGYPGQRTIHGTLAVTCQVPGLPTSIHIASVGFTCSTFFGTVFAKSSLRLISASSCVNNSVNVQEAGFCIAAYRNGKHNILPVRCTVSCGGYCHCALLPCRVGVYNGNHAVSLRPFVGHRIVCQFGSLVLLVYVVRIYGRYAFCKISQPGKQAVNACRAPLCPLVTSAPSHIVSYSYAIL